MAGEFIIKNGSIISGSLEVTGGITGSIVASSASFAETASYVNPLVQDVLITGSLTVSGSSTFTNIGPAVLSGSLTVADIVSGIPVNVIRNDSNTTLPFKITNNNVSGSSGITFSLPNINSQAWSIGADRDRNFKIGEGYLSNNTTFTITPSLRVGIGTTSPTAKLQVKGSGTTSSTTSLLVENSNGDDAFIVKDDRTVTSSLDMQIKGITYSAGASTFAADIKIGKNLSTTNSEGNIAIGDGVLSSLTTTSNTANVALGVNALASTTNGFDNIAIGRSALNAQTTGDYSVAIGYEAMKNAGDYAGLNVGIGYQALRDTQGSDNIAIGERSLYQQALGSNNTGVGYITLSSLVTGSSNTSIGIYSGGNFASGSYNTFIGPGGNVGGTPGPIASGDNNTIIGGNFLMGAFGSNDVSNTVVLADGVGDVRFYSPSSKNVLIGSLTDTGEKLQISGSVKIESSGSTVMSVEGSVGNLFTIEDTLTGSLMSVGNVSGLPLLEVFDDGTMNAGKYNVYPIKIIDTGSKAEITGSILTDSLIATTSINANAGMVASGSVAISGGALGVVSTGTSNATSGLKVQNSTPDVTLEVKDDGELNINTTKYSNNGVLTNNGGVVEEVAGWTGIININTTPPIAIDVQNGIIVNVT